jgi:hypothetical protein
LRQNAIASAGAAAAAIIGADDEIAISEMTTATIVEAPMGRMGGIFASVVDQTLFGYTVEYDHLRRVVWRL